MEDGEQPFVAFVLEALTHQSTELAQRWANRARLAAADFGELNSSDDASEISNSAERLVGALLTAAADHVHQHEPLIEAGAAMGLEAHRRNSSLHLILKEIDLLGALVLQAAEDVATNYSTGTAAHEGLAAAQRIADATSQFRLAAVMGYTQAIEDELRNRYRIIRHDLRNPLGTIRTAVALLTDESAPPAMRESRRVQAMVVRNTSLLDQMLSEALSDAAARLRAFDTTGGAAADVPADMLADSSTESDASDLEEGDNITRSRQRPDLESGAF
jgi:hypothetical protein